MEYTFKITISACAHHTWQGVLDAISNQMYLEDMEVFSWEKLPWEENAKV